MANVIPYPQTLPDACSEDTLREESFAASGTPSYIQPQAPIVIPQLQVQDLPSGSTSWNLSQQNPKTAVFSEFLEIWNSTSATAAEQAVLFEQTQFVEQTNFHSWVLSTLEAEPVEDGVIHDAEMVLSKALSESPLCAPNWIQVAFMQTLAKPSLAAGLLQCIGRLDYNLVSSIATPLVVSGLKQSSVEIREAAISAIEQWESSELSGILLRHTESVTWLAEYAERVFQEISMS